MEKIPTKPTETCVTSESLSGGASCFCLCICSESLWTWAVVLIRLCFSSWTGWTQLPLSLLITLCLWLDLETDRLVCSSEEGTAFNFPLGCKLLPICIGHGKICIPLKGKYGLTYYSSQLDSVTGLYASTESMILPSVASDYTQLEAMNHSGGFSWPLEYKLPDARNKVGYF